MHMETGISETLGSTCIRKQFRLVLQRGIPEVHLTFTSLCGLRMYQAFGVDDAIAVEFTENSICCQLPVNDPKLQKLVNRQIQRHSHS